jgi:hypothetical protein
LVELLPVDGRVDPDTRREVLRLSSDLRKTFDFHIDTSSSRNYYYLKFYFPEPLEDHETLRERTVEVLSFASEGLNIITETAEWLMGEEFADAVQVVQSRGLPVRLILAALGPEDDGHRTTQEAKWQRLIGEFPAGLINIRILPWEDHEIHMTTTSDGRGIYFVRRHKETKFIPWHISDPRDAQQVLAEFNRFWSKAVKWEPTLPAPISGLASVSG